jgi:hypothetical protein
LQHRNATVNVPETATAIVSFTNPDETEMGDSEQLEGEKYKSRPEYGRRVE